MGTFFTISSIVGNYLGQYLFNKGFDKLSNTQEDFKQELTKVINESLDEYEKLYPQNDIGKQYAFYKSQKIISELLYYRVMHPEDYNVDTLLHAFDTEINVIPPEKSQIENFYSIFLQKINANDKLKSLEIRQTFDNEIFRISQKLDALHRYIENILLTFSGDLELQWKDRLDTYITTLQQFKPQTALSLLEALEHSFTTSTKKPSKEFCSLISYQKGICYSFLGERNKMCECFITAYQNNLSEIRFEEQAALSYFKIGETAKANDLINDLLCKNEFNPIAWYIRFLNNTTLDFNTIPEFVRKNVLFQQMLFNYFNVKDLYDYILQMKALSMLPDSKDYRPQDVTINTFDENIFYSNVFFSDYLHDYCFIFYYLNDGNTELLKTLDELLSKLISAINGSELEKKYSSLFFLHAYVQYILTKDIKYVSEMRSYYLTLEKKNYIFTLLCANVLQLVDQTDFAIEILNNPEFKQSDIFFLKAYCFIKKNDAIQYRKAIKEWLTVVDEIDERKIDSYLASVFTLKGIRETNDLKLSDFIQNVTFENEELKSLTETIVNSLIKETMDTQQLSTLDKLILNIQQPKLLLYVADAYYYCKMYELAIDLYRKHVDRDFENRELFFYINSLYATKKYSDELFELLEKWRLNFSFQPDLYKIEADMCSILHNWNRGLQICNQFLSNKPKDENFLSLKLKCLDCINEDWCDTEIESIAKIFTDYSFSIIQNIPIIATILVNRGHFVEGLDILYRYSENQEVRSAYLFATVIYSQKSQNKDILKEYDEIVEGCFVKYEYDNSIHFVEMNKKKTDGNLYDELLGHKIGDIISFNRMTGKTYLIKILRIMDKYLCLHDKILEEAKQPLSGLPMEPFNFTSTDPEAMVQDLITLLGQRGDKEKQRMESVINGYYNRTLSFSEVIIQAFRNDYLGGYTSLIYDHSGISIIPLLNYESLKQPANNPNYIIDFSSLAILYQIAREHNITFPHKFLISIFLVEMIKQEIRKNQIEPKSELSVVVTSEGITKYHIPENLQQNNITYLSGLLNWVQEHCESIVSPRVIDFRRNLNSNFEYNNFLDYILNTMLIFEDKQGILLTDDLIYFKYKFAPIQYSVSTEQYVKNILGDEHPALFEFIKNKYRGFTLNTKQLVDEYNKKINSQNNYYTYCLENLSMRVALPCIKLVKAIIISKLSIEQQEIEIKNVFVNMFKDTPQSERLKQYFEMMLKVEFNYLYEKSNFIFNCLKESYQILGY